MKPFTSQATIKVGDVLKIDGGLCVCSRWSESNATMVPLQKAQKTIKPRGDVEKFGGKEVKFSAPDSKTHHISSETPGPFIASLGENWKTADLKTAIAGFAGEVNVPPPAAHEKAAAAVKKKTQQLNTIAPEPTAALPTTGEGGKCAFIDNLLETGKYTKLEIIDLTVKKFGGPPLATARTLGARPSIMRAKGRTAKFRE